MTVRIGCVNGCLPIPSIQYLPLTEREIGPVTDTGYGINYAIAKDYIKFSIGSKYSCTETSSPQFRYVLNQAFADMFALVQKMAPANAKL